MSRVSWSLLSPRITGITLAPEGEPRIHWTPATILPYLALCNPSASGNPSPPRDASSPGPPVRPRGVTPPLAVSCLPPLAAPRFSTKPFEADAGVCHSGFRDHDLLAGRWLNRDPIREEGGTFT